MGFYARILIRKVIINNGDFMIQELNQQLKSMYLEPKTKLRVDVDYVIGRLENIVDTKTNICKDDQGNPLYDREDQHNELEEFLAELELNNFNHEEKNNGN